MDTEVVAAETEWERESAYVSRKRMWRTPLVPSSITMDNLKSYLHYEARSCFMYRPANICRSWVYCAALR